MPPKKPKSPSTEKKPPEKVVKKRVKAVKPKLKIPSIVKVKIPSGQSLSTKAAPAPKLTRKQLTTQVKIDLANEVARAQLVKTEPVKFEPLEDVAKVKTVRRGRQKKVVSNFFNEADTAVPTETTKKIIKSNKTKPTEDAETEEKPIATAKKRITNSTEKPKPAKKPKLTKSKTAITNNSKTIKKKNVVACEQPQDLKVTKSKSIVRKSRPRLAKGKVNKSDDISTDNTHDSPSILNTMVYENVSSSKAVELDDEHKAAVPIDSRKTSVTSNSSISWTKDISSSSTTTCVTVTSNDYVRINRKMPIVSLTNVESVLMRNAPKVMESSSSPSSSSSSDSDSSSSESIETIPETNCSLLGVNTQVNLSVSSPSVSNRNDSPRIVARNNVSHIGAALDRLSAQLKRFDLEIVNWIGYENESNNDDAKKFHDKITEIFKEESDVILHCRQIKKILADDIDKGVKENADIAVSPEKSREAFNIANTETLDISIDDIDGDTHFDSEDNNILLENYNKSKTPPAKIQKELSSSDSENFTSDKVRYTPFDYNNDDDDALSLFAESITGFESSKMNSSIPSTSSVHHDEYIPEPITKERRRSSPDKLTYCPTKITFSTNGQKNLNSKNKSICEKQNADSTSIKESERCKSVEDNIFVVPDQQININKDSVKSICQDPPIRNGNMPCFMASRYKRLYGQKSIVFKGICFFNLISSCKNARCRFPHVEFSMIEIKSRLMRLSEDLFIQEYMLMRNWPSLRRKYALCFVEECQRRDLTNILVEMSIDCVIKANETSREDALLKTEVIEFTLLHLNTVNLIDYKDFLLYKVHKGSLLCDVYIQVISDTQNFSRFKLVFLNLVQFIIDNGRTFRLSVTEHILERVCILPYEEPLIRAVVNMIRNTDASILQNSMMRLFEKQLAIVGKEFYENFMEFKKQATLNQRVVVSPFVESPPLLNEVETVAVVKNTQTDRGERYTSPDTTNLDGLNKVIDEPIITRTINMNPSRLMGFQQSLTPKDKGDFRPKNKYSHWKNKSIMMNIFNGYSPQMNSPVIRPPLTPPANLQATQRQVTYKTSPTNFTRRTGADF